ncbi:vomeronasal 1 receptor ornAnaV1R3070 isoform X1 [Ornithorhynchus anatinus]|uniref:Vomeronasal type-1 receptor n=1 Tax=Ornithorhynchus anatinus TaxID=9258 RepID=F6UIM5_ORNAN|nr:vomeronasal 1 receptor ornAnaV1R3070 [Ornithorhynchus anatinus]XP_028912502.1 vomeronasal 1 receptor ornAnaV1R3070 isoform X1 [Ornithorhynchus anatinus]XP_028912503.1 vomeronasal 1 receptor ornAnaV1R3070 isoform X1 [Ornithorhynchus anatinus]XP_039766931.1 vomeronasal 1 receptor ornAnaV1R3070 isoform X1 [Ornithorhynchus anatinus]
MDTRKISTVTLILIEMGTGVSGNVFLLLVSVRTVSTNHKPSSSERNLIHLALANILMLLTRGIPETMAAGGWRNFLDVVGCKILFYFHRVACALSLCTTCLLSIFQAITISSGTSRWAAVKSKLHKCIIPSCLLSWVVNLLVNVTGLIYISGPLNTTRNTVLPNYCSSVSVTAGITLVNAIVLSLRDLFFVGTMSVASSYMVFILHRHHRQVRHLHGLGRSPKEMPEVRTAKRVIALVTLYVLLSGRDAATLSSLLKGRENSPELVSSHLVLTFTFLAFSLFLLIHSNQRMRMFRKRKSPISNADGIPSPRDGMFSPPVTP